MFHPEEYIEQQIHSFADRTGFVPVSEPSLIYSDYYVIFHEGFTLTLGDIANSNRHGMSRNEVIEWLFYCIDTAYYIDIALYKEGFREKSLPFSRQKKPLRKYGYDLINRQVPVGIFIYRQLIKHRMVRIYVSKAVIHIHGMFNYEIPLGEDYENYSFFILTDLGIKLEVVKHKSIDRWYLRKRTSSLKGDAEKTRYDGDSFPFIIPHNIAHKLLHSYKSGVPKLTSFYFVHCHNQLRLHKRKKGLKELGEGILWKRLPRNGYL